MAELKTEAEALEELGLTATAPDEAIRAAFRQRLKQAHPDLNGGTDAQLRRLILARDMLTSDTNTPLKQTDFPQQFDRNEHRSHGARPLHISLHQALFGGSVSMNVPALEFAEADEPLASLIETRNLHIILPPGLRDGAVVNLACDAYPGQRLFSIHIKTDDDCRVWGEDIWMIATIESRFLRGGGQTTIDTPHGPRHISIATRTPSGASLCLKGQGLPATETASAGDLHIRLEACPDSLRPAGHVLTDFRQRWAS
ncbi:DnaJ C-terminal domain-containing protein [Asticcacaulis sp.]|uniref:DnaJ C-terminal domain-containing protein n=1 Tax=Asticcacaulis sp. TaxID=1872648 RepID=UPI003F7CCEF3